MLNRPHFLYVIFDPSPSSIVRAAVFKEKFRFASYEVDYIFLYSRTIAILLSLSIVTRRFFVVVSKCFQMMQDLIKVLLRFWLLVRVSRYDGIILIKYVHPNLIDKIRSRTKAKILYDFDDAMWYPPSMEKKNSTL